MLALVRNAHIDTNDQSFDQTSGNKPPGELPAKAAYSAFDSKRAQAYFGLSFETPSFFPILSLRPQRSLVYVKANYPRDVYEGLWLQCFQAMWNEHLDLSIPDNMLTCLLYTSPSPRDGLLSRMPSSA